MIGRGSTARAARLLCAAGPPFVLLFPPCAQSVPVEPSAPSRATEPELDPNAPLDPMPDLGVDWPDLNAKETAPTIQQRRSGRPEDCHATDDRRGTATLRYTVESRACAAGDAAEDLLNAFRQQSALEAERKKPANAAQIGRRAGADADLARRNCCAARAIMTRPSSRGPNAAATALTRRPRRRSRSAISLRVGRAPGPRGGRPGCGQACATPSPSRPAIR